MSPQPHRIAPRSESPPSHRVSPPPAATRQKDIALIDLLDRLLDGGVVLAGDITLAVADVDLVYVGLRALVSSVAAAERQGVALPR
jgi:Gas vesicle protein